MCAYVCEREQERESEPRREREEREERERETRESGEREQSSGTRIYGKAASKTETKMVMGGGWRFMRVRGAHGDAAGSAQRYIVEARR